MNRLRALNAAPVAQLDRAPDYESGGQEFESLPVHQRFPRVFREHPADVTAPLQGLLQSAVLVCSGC